MGLLARLAAVLAVSASVVSAQTYTDCDPLLTTCPDNKALSGKYYHNYAQSKSPAPDIKKINAGDVLFENDGAHFRVAKSGDSATLISNFYFMYGRFEVRMKSARGQGIVSSIVIQSDVRDEVDWELLGSRPTRVQTNYFGKGNTESYDRMVEYDMANNQDQFHTYAIDWTAERVQWIIDGAVIRTLTPAEVKGDFYPQTPMTARLGNWAGGDPKNEPGTIEWAGGETDFRKGPFDMIVESISVQDYSTGKVYRYSDKSGSAKSIIAVDGQIMGGDKNGGSNPPPPKDSSSTPLPTTSFRAPTNSGRVSTPAPTPSPSGSPSPSGGSNDDDDDESSTTQSSVLSPQPTGRPAPGSNPVNTDDDPDSAAGKHASNFALFALVAIGAAFVF